jgi:hypothetical protein
LSADIFFDTGTRSGDFFYNWSELSCSPTDWFRVGSVVERTQAASSNSDVRRGLLVGFKCKHVDLTTYRLSAGSKEATFVFDSLHQVLPPLIP